MLMLDKTIAASRALVIDPNSTSRSILCAQLRDLGVGNVVQASRLRDARNHLEARPFDIVLCEMDFRDGDQTGQELLEELRRDALMPLSTVFVMVTGEATYARVAEAAEAGLDSYLVKPFTSTTLMERLQRSRRSKSNMMEILTAVESGQFERASQLCLVRVKERAPNWLYAARIGAELLLRMEQPAVARQLLEVVAQAHGLPWARLGVARSQLAEHQVGPAMTTLKALVTDEAGYTEAYDVMGRTSMLQGDLAAALRAYRKGSDLTPGSIGRQQKLGVLAFYMGEHAIAGKALERALLIGLNSKSFDPLVLLLLAIVRYHQADAKGLKRCQTDLAQALERSPKSARLKRFLRLVQVFELLLARQQPAALTEMLALAGELRGEDFDVEAACNLLAVLARLAVAGIHLPEADAWVETIGLRYCTTKGVSELLIRTAGLHEPYAKIMQQAQTSVAQRMEHAMTHNLSGDPNAALKALLEQAHATLNPRFADAARRMLQRHGERINKATALAGEVEAVAAKTPPVVGPPLGRDGLDGGLKLRADGVAGAELADAAAGRAAPVAAVNP